MTAIWPDTNPGTRSTPQICVEMQPLMHCRPHCRPHSVLFVGDSYSQCLVVGPSPNQRIAHVFMRYSHCLLALGLIKGKRAGGFVVAAVLLLLRSQKPLLWKQWLDRSSKVGQTELRTGNVYLIFPAGLMH